MSSKKLTSSEKESLLKVLEERFGQNINLHPNVSWKEILVKLEKSDTLLWTINEMEKSGGEPDVVEFKGLSNLVYADTSTETPKGRRSLCYDKAAWDSRKANKPISSAEEMALEIGIQILDEEQYMGLQDYKKIDLKTSSWLKTPEQVRKLGGAIFGDRRFDRVFIYHNGADSYYSVRGFRGFIEI